MIDFFVKAKAMNENDMVGTLSKISLMQLLIKQESF